VAERQATTLLCKLQQCTGASLHENWFKFISLTDDRFMFELLDHKITEKISLTEEEKAYCHAQFIPKKLRKRHYLLQEGDVCRYQAFVAKGMMRSYTIDEKGAEHIRRAFAIHHRYIGRDGTTADHPPGMGRPDAKDTKAGTLFPVADTEPPDSNPAKADVYPAGNSRREVQPFRTGIPGLYAAGTSTPI
jgi:hypothetical protein